MTDREAMAKRLFETSLYGDDEDVAASWDDLADHIDAPSGTEEFKAELKANRDYWFKLADVALAESEKLRSQLESVQKRYDAACEVLGHGPHHSVSLAGRIHILKEQLVKCREALKPLASIPLWRDTYPDASYNKAMALGTGITVEMVTAARVLLTDDERSK